MSNGQQVIDNSLFDESNLEPENGFTTNENIKDYISSNLLDKHGKIVNNKSKLQKVAEAEEYLREAYQNRYRKIYEKDFKKQGRYAPIRLERTIIHASAHDFDRYQGNNNSLDFENTKGLSIFDTSEEKNNKKEKYNQNFNKAFEKKFKKNRNTKNQEQVKISTKAHINDNEQTAPSTKKKISFKKINELFEKTKNKKEFLNKIFKKSNTKPLKRKKIQKNLVNNMKKVKSSSTKVDRKFTQVELLDKKRLNLNPNLRVPKKKNKIPNTWKNIAAKGQYNGTKNILNRVENNGKYQLFCQNNYR